MRHHKHQAVRLFEEYATRKPECPECGGHRIGVYFDVRFSSPRATPEGWRARCLNCQFITSCQELTSDAVRAFEAVQEKRMGMDSKELGEHLLKPRPKWFRREGR